MIRLFLNRLAVSIPLLLLVSAVTFLLQSFVPGDPARTILGTNATEERYEQLRATLQLDDPFFVRYGDYLGGLFQGDLGNSIFTAIPVATSISQRLPVSLSLMIGATLIATVLGILLGVLSSTRGRGLSKAIDALSMTGFALPNFWLALVLASLFAITIPLFPATGYEPISGGVSTWAMFLVLPWFALSLNGVATIAKVTRDSMMTNLNADYIRTLRAAGVPRRSVVWKHGLRNSGVQIVTMVGLAMIAALAGTVFVENVFALPGLGSLAVSSINDHDMPLTQGVVLTYTVIVVVINLAVDVAYSIINPKVRVS